MNVLFIASMYVKPDGAYAGLAVHRQATELMRKGLGVEVVCPLRRFDGSLRSLFSGPTEPERRMVGLPKTRRGGVPVTYIPYPNVPLGISPWAHAAILRRYLSRSIDSLRASFDFDLVHSHHLFPVGYVAGKLAQELDVPFIASAVGSDVHKHPNRNRGIRKRTVITIQEATFVCAVSRGLADEIEELTTPRRPVRVVRRGVDPTQFNPEPPSKELRKRLGLPPNGIGFCCVSRLVTEKGLGELTAALEELVPIFPDSWLALVGDGPFRADLQSEIRLRGLEKRVFFAGRRDHHEIGDWLNASDIFVLASYAEGLPNVILEAMSCALPVVATDVGGVAEAVDDGVTGILVPSRSVTDLRKALVKLGRNAILRRQLGRAGRQRILDEFTWSKSAARLEELYEDAIRFSE